MFIISFDPSFHQEAFKSDICFCICLQLEQYKLVSQSFEKRVLDLQKDLKKKEDEIAALKKNEDVLQHNINHVKHDGR